ncbi:MAG TPA: aryl-sulfate sulfotransferase [Dehalococcoidia bacterium]|nr:aryl-sulfate sulfotransferase [Dehalococcoidia bacterium]
MGWSPFRKTGLTHYEPYFCVKGYTLVTPMAGDSAYLIDMEGSIVHRWRLPGFRLFYGRLLPNGNLLVMGTDASLPAPQIAPGTVPEFAANIRRIGGNATHLHELDWDGNVVWRYENPAMHHDFVRLPNGNTLMPVFVELPAELAAAVRGGYRIRERLPPMISDDVLEVDARGVEVRRIHLWQLLDPRRDPLCPLERRLEWTHTNSLDVNAQGDILFSCRQNSRIGIVDGASGKLLWKLGAPEVHHQHHATFLRDGKVQVFDNGMHRPANPRSAVVEIDTKTNAVTWQFVGVPEQQFFSGHISGAERLAGENVLVCEGTSGRVFEVTRRGEVVWEWISPFVNRNPAGMAMSWLFRAHRYEPDHPALAGRDLDPARYRDLNRLHGLEGNSA